MYGSNDTEPATEPVTARPTLRVAWFGTSLVEHLEAHNPCLTTQADLPEIGSLVEVTSWRHRGYPHSVMLALMVRHPWITFDINNFGEGGATSVDVQTAVEAASRAGRWDLAFFGCGINDVWRRHQGRLSEAVGIDEFDASVRASLGILTSRAERVLVIGEPPIGWDPGIDVAAANAELTAYNQCAHQAANDYPAQFIDLWDEMISTAKWFGWALDTPNAPAEGSASLWTDGVHLSEFGDELVRQIVTRHIAEQSVIEDLLL